MMLEKINLNALQKISIRSGLFLITLASVCFLGGLFGLLELESFAFGGSSGLRTLAGIAVAGCLLAAVGTWDE